MKYTSRLSWSKLPIDDFRPIFFVEMFVEKLSLYTPHFHQSRLMNVYSAARETLTYIDEQHLSDKNGAYILCGIEEIDSCLTVDTVAQSLLGKLEIHRHSLFKNISGGNLSLANLNRLSSICKSILSTSDDYQTKLLTDLHFALFCKEDCPKIARIAQNISTLTGLYITHLLQKGFSPTYLYNRVDMFRHLNNYAGRSFQEQFEFITDRLKNHTTAFEVFFGLQSSRINIFAAIPLSPTFEFVQTPPDCLIGPDLEKLKKDLEHLLIHKSPHTLSYIFHSREQK